MLFMQIIIKCQFWCWVLKDIAKKFVQPYLNTSTKLTKCDIDFFPKKQVKVVEFTLKDTNPKKSNFCV